MHLNARRIVELLESVACGRLEVATALEAWRDFEEEPDRMIRAAFHELGHFAADADIRARDQDHAEGQRERLLRSADRIRRKYRLG